MFFATSILQDKDFLKAKVNFLRNWPLKCNFIAFFLDALLKLALARSSFEGFLRSDFCNQKQNIA